MGVFLFLMNATRELSTAQKRSALFCAWVRITASSSPVESLSDEADSRTKISTARCPKDFIQNHRAELKKMSQTPYCTHFNYLFRKIHLSYKNRIVASVLGASTKTEVTLHPFRGENVSVLIGI